MVASAYAEGAALPASASARAPQVVPASQDPMDAELPPAIGETTQDIANRSLKGPRAETVAGVLVTATAPLVGATIAFLAGPGIFYCGIFGDPDPACEARREREEDRAMRLALGVSVPWGVAGIA